MQNHASLSVIGRVYTDLLGSVSMRDLDSPAIIGILLVHKLKEAGLVIVDLEQTQALPGMLDDTEQLPVLDAPCLALEAST
jgi:hypothetical protein